LKRHEFWWSQRGFTLPELMITIVLLGIVLAIVSSTWFGAVESRDVDSAANQFISDVRLAHTRATNQLSNWQVVHAVGSADYQLVRVDDGSVINRSLPENTKVLSSEANGPGSQRKLVFNPNGEASAQGGFTDSDGDGAIDVIVSSTDDNPQHSVSVIPATSRVKID
jgi:prepilin-type N-terminal cleavage/methylation domain-containing protein